MGTASWTMLRLSGVRPRHMLAAVVTATRCTPVGKKSRYDSTCGVEEHVCMYKFTTTWLKRCIIQEVIGKPCTIQGGDRLCSIWMLEICCESH